MNFIRRASIIATALLIIATFSARAQEHVRELDQLAPGDPIAALLGEAGMSPDDLKLPMNELALRLMAASPLRPPGLFYTIADDPLRASWQMTHYRQRIFHAKEYLRKIIMYMTARIDVSLFRGYHSNPWREIEQRLKDESDPLMYYLDQAAVQYGEPLDEEDRDQIRARLNALPAELRAPLATLLSFGLSSAKWQGKAFENWRADRNKDQINNLTRHPLFTDGASTEDDDIREYMARPDYAYLAAGAQDIAEGLDRALPLLLKARPSSTDTLTWSMNTPLGLIYISWGDTNDTYNVPRGQNAFLILDFAGNDTYLSGAANESTTQPISLIIDIAGNDTYLCRERFRPCFGAGIGGYGALIDIAGNDRYMAGQFSQGAAFLGMGLLWDKAGDDSYSALQMSQGAAMGGLALLYDVNGNDSYSGYTEIQGFGSTRGFGLLMDDKGNDSYVCLDDRLFAPSAQASGHNNSLGQGAGKGWRSDLTDGHSIPGGVGMLLDEEGDDTYQAAVMAQGVGFWSGAGILMDMKGNDRYTGLYYVQGAGIHSSAGVLLDYDGNDTYTATLYVAQGAGHDWSVGYLLDAAGDDHYESPSISLGSGNQNGIGIFLELGGDDTYQQSKTRQTQGLAKMSKWGTQGEDMLNAGLFFDLGGEDIYPSGRKTSNNSYWIQEPEFAHQPRLKSQWGLGLDGEFPQIMIPFHPITPYTPDD